ncbi:MAG: hypothetical protein ACREIA_15885 [Opitutaceae bacterium]
MTTSTMASNAQRQLRKRQKRENNSLSSFLETLPADKKDELLVQAMERVITNDPSFLTKNRTVTQQVIRAEARSGPLPSPDEFERFETVVPGTGNQIVQMARTDQRCTWFHVYLSHGYRYCGLGSATALGGIFIWRGFDLLDAGKNWEGFGALAAAVVSIAGAFILERSKRKK